MTELQSRSAKEPADQHGGASDPQLGTISQPSGPATVSYLRLYSTADTLDKALITLGLVGAAGGGVLLPLFSIVFGDFVDAFGKQGSDFTHTISNLALKFLYIAIAAFVAMWLEVTMFVLAGERQTIRLRQRFLQSVLAQDIAFFDTAATTGGLLQGLNEDSMNVQAAISDKAANFMHHMCTFISGFIIAFTKGWDMTLVLLGCLPFLAVMGSFIGKLAGASTERNAKAYTQASSIAQQSIASVRTVAAYNGQSQTIAAYTQSLEKPLKEGIKSGFFVGSGLGGLQFVMYCAYAVAIFYGSYRIAAGKYTGGQVLAVQIATLMASFAIGQAAPNVQHFAAGKVSGYRMFTVIDRKPALVDVGAQTKGSDGSNSPPDTASCDTNGSPAKLSVVAHNGTGELASIEGKLEFHDVHFAYPARRDITVFRGFNLVVPAGHTVALVGSSGSGKSTAIQLIERFYDPISGAITLDGVDIRALKLQYLRSHVGLVSQEPTLFATTIYDNIAIGREGATKKEVIAAAAAANAHKFIMALPEGYNTQVGERGVQLSGGQKQRIAIARAVLKNPKVLLLDEATSALDTNSERIVQAALDKMVIGRTTVVVAHRLSTIRHAHAIAVVSNGQIVEQGTHDTLLSNPQGAYSILVQMQMQAAQKEQEEQHAQEGSLITDPDAIAAVHEEEHDEEHGEDDEDDEGRGFVEIDVDPAHGEAKPTVNAAVTAAATLGAAGASVVPVTTNPQTSSAPEKIDIAMGGGHRTSTTGSGALKEILVGGVGDRLSIEHGNPAMKALTDKQREKEQAAADEAAGKKVPFSRLLSMNKPEWPAIFIGCIASAVAGLQHPAMAFVLSDITVVFYLTDMDELKRKASFYAWMFFVIACGALISVALQQLCLSWAGQRLALRIRTKLLGALLRQEVAFFDRDENSSGRLSSALATDAAYIRGAVGDAAGVALQNLSTLALGYVISFAYNWQMALLITGTFPVLFAAMGLQMKWAIGSSTASDTLYASANQYIGEAFANIRVIQAYNLQPYICGMYNKMLAATRPVLTRQAHLGGIGMGFSFGCIFALYGLIIYFGGWQVAHNKVDFEGFLKGFLAVLLAAMGMAQAGAAFPDLGKAAGAVGRVFPLLDRQPEIDPDAPGEEKPAGEVKGEVEFEHIKFVYPSRPTVVIYSDFNLHIPAGKVYALVGESGSGKSTVVSLLERFYAPTQGRVLLDGVDIANYQLKWLRQQIGLVSQEPILFAGSVYDNICYGSVKAVSMEEAEAAARVANAHEFVEKLPEGYRTQVGEGGIQLSGGQKQRIAIARAVLKNPKVLLLDEATSALDARSERVVQDALDAVMTGRTCLVIAHRLSTIRNAHAICVLYRGAVLEQGTHDELLAIPGGAYAKLVAAQEGTHRTAE